MRGQIRDLNIQRSIRGVRTVTNLTCRIQQHGRTRHLHRSVVHRLVNDATGPQLDIPGTRVHTHDRHSIGLANVNAAGIGCGGRSQGPAQCHVNVVRSTGCTNRAAAAGGDYGEVVGGDRGGGVGDVPCDAQPQVVSGVCANVDRAQGHPVALRDVGGPIRGVDDKLGDGQVQGIGGARADGGGVGDGHGPGGNVHCRVVAAAVGNVARRVEGDVAGARVHQTDWHVTNAIDQNVAVITGLGVRVQQRGRGHVKDAVGTDAADRSNQVNRPANDIRSAIVGSAVDVTGRVQCDIAGARADQPDRGIADVVDQDVAVIARHGVSVQLRGAVHVKDAVRANAANRGDQVDRAADNVCRAVIGRAVNITG